MTRLISSLAAVLVLASTGSAQTAPSYSKEIRPFFAKYCLECHNTKTLKGALSLETYKEMMDGGDRGPVLIAGQPDKSRLVLLTEHKEKPTMPPAKAKFQPTKDEVKLLRAWVAAGARDDAANVKVELPVVKAKGHMLGPVTALYSSEEVLCIARKEIVTTVKFSGKNIEANDDRMSSSVTAFSSSQIVAIDSPQGGAVFGNMHGLPQPGFEIGRHTDTILDLAFGKKAMASASYDSRINLYHHGLLPNTVVLKEHSDAVYGLAFNPDGKQLASVSADRAMKVWDVEKGKLLYTLGEATDWLYTVAWSPNGKYLVSGGVDKSIRVYETSPAGSKLRQSVFAHEGAVQKVLFSSDSKTLYSVGQDRVVKAWDVEKMVERKVYDKQPETVLCMALREDAGQIIVGRYDGIVQLIDMKTGKVVYEFGKVNAPKPRDERSDSRGLNPHPQPLSQGARGVLHPQESLRSSWGLSPASAPKLALPADLPGTLDRAGVVHYFRVDVTKGQPLGIVLETKEVKSKVEPVLVVTDMAGKIVAESYDGHLGHTFAEAGAYAVGVRDRDFRGGADFKYRLKLGNLPIVTAVFPMGMKIGSKGDIQLEGVFLPKNVVTLAVPADAKPGQVIPLLVGDGVLGKAQIVAGELPEVVGVGKMAMNSTANGRILRDNQNDLWSFPARKNQPLVVEVNARRIGSRLDSIIEILGPDDLPVPRAVLRSQAKTHVTFRDHDSVQGNIRIEAWSELTTNDYLYVGGELMKIQALPTHPDADCTFFATQGQRIGYMDTTPTHHANNTPMYKVNVHPPGAAFPPNGYPVFTLHYRNDDGGPGFGRDSRILFDPPADGQYKIRIADARGMGGVNFGYRLTVRQPKESFTLKTTPLKPSVSKGGAIPITITADRIDGFDGPITVQATNLPPGFHMPATTIEAGTYATTVALYADANARLPAKTLALLEGSAPGKSIQSPFELPTLLEPGDLVTTTAESAVAIKPGEQAKLIVRIERRNGFTGRVPLDVKGLPHGVRVLDIGLNGILVNEKETTREVVIYAEPWVQAQEHPFVVLARREGKNSEHAAKAVVLRVK